MLENSFKLYSSKDLIFKYHSKRKSLITLPFIRLPILLATVQWNFFAVNVNIYDQIKSNQIRIMT